MLNSSKAVYILGFSLSAFLLLSLSGCEEVDDQTYSAQAEKQAVNPEPTPRNFVKNNSDHKILMAVIDSGTDYNHPRIEKNIHFELDQNGKPIGVGYDFIGEDRWPAPYVARTADLNPQASRDDAEKVAQGRKQSQIAQRRFPHLQKYLEPERNLEQEQSSDVVHGTHVGGLMVYDAPELGLLIYRVLPTNIVFKENRRDYRINKTQLVFENILKSMKMAVAAGARVVNMSLTISSKRDGDGSLFSSSASEAEMKQQAARIQIVKNLIAAHPDVVFVAASGNQNGWIDGDSVMQLPCGVNLPNVLCVGALDSKNRLSSFSNIPLNNPNFLAAPGLEIVSLYPTKMCESTYLKSLNAAPGAYPFQNSNQTEAYWKYIQKDCENSKGLKAMSGTSMASPIAARALGLILSQQPHLKGSEAISVLIKSGERVHLGNFSFTRIRVPKPSWYPARAGDKEKLMNPTSLTQKKESPTGYFDFLTETRDEI